jgi:ribosome-associated toxin RatA of RatAB toxin-antitoxin module
MISIKENRIVDANAEDLYKIVCDINNYQSFLPWCKKSEIISQNENIIKAKLSIKFGIFSISYISNVTIDSENLIINVASNDYPFRNLQTCWEFEKLSDVKTLIKFSHNMSIKNFLMEKFVKKYIGYATNKVIDRFLEQV